jgi:hypothetical protein
MPKILRYGEFISRLRDFGVIGEQRPIYFP